MKFCTTCGEVYPSESSACSADGSALQLWTRRAFEPTEASEESKGFERSGSGTTPDGRTLVEGIEDSNQKTDVQLAGGAPSAKARGKGQNLSVGPFVEEATDVEQTNVQRQRIGPSASARGKKQHLTDVGSDVGEHTDVVEIGQPVTLPEFDASAPNLPVRGSGDLVVYDQQNEGPFQGMLISNRYRLESRIGTGGFGVVFDALDKEENKRVAIKILSPALSQDRRALARFRREAIAASRIQHPGIIKIDDFGIEDDGISYIVMEFLPGQDLAALLESEGKLSPARAANLIMQCAEALSAAHEAGVLHRDLKPANIFVIEENGVERVKIIDFGIAKDQSSNPRTADLTSASKVVGTPYYMSPEQARGNQLDGRADVYSLGVILFELVTGTRPFEAPSVLEILMAHSKAPRVRPSSLCPELASEIALENVVLKSIQARAKLRFADMTSFASALKAYLDPAAPLTANVNRPYAARTDELLMRPGASTSQAASNEITRRHGLLLSRLPLPLWTAVVPALALVLLFSLLRSGESSSDASQELPTSTRPPKAAAAPPVPAPKPASALDDVSMEFELDEADVIEKKTGQSQPAPKERSGSGSKQTARKNSSRADEGAAKGKTAARKNTRKSQAISEW